MSHRNNDNNVPWNNRNPRNGGGDGNYKGSGNWTGNNRYGSDNRYNNNNKDRRNNYRGGGGYGGGGRRNYDDRRSYRNNPWNNNNSGPDGNYPRYQSNWLQKGHPDKYGMQQLPESVDIMQQQIPPLMIDFGESVPEETEQSQGKIRPSGSGDADGRKSSNGIADGVVRSECNRSQPWQQDGFGSPGDGFQGFADDDFTKTSNGCSKVNAKPSSAKDDKGDVSLPENELRTLIVDEALKIISDAEQPACSSATQKKSSEATPTATATSVASNSTSTTANPERRASIERSAEQVTRKLINQLTSMNKHSLKQVINNPDSKFETALKTHARQKLRAEVRRQLRNFNLNESTAQTKTSCGMLEPDECVDSDKIPEALLEQIGKVLDLNLLDLNVTEESGRDATPSGEEEDCVINSNEADYSATEVLDKNLRLTDEDEQLDTDDLFARAELLLMKGSESVRQGSSSGPSSPTDEMFPNEQIDSIVSEENGEDVGDPDADPDQEQIEKMLDERLAPSFPCFLRVSTVEELNKKVNDLPAAMDESPNDTVPVELSAQESENSSSNPETPPEVIDTPPVAEEQPEPQISQMEIAATNVSDQPDAVENPMLDPKKEVVEPTLPPKEEVVEPSLSPKEDDALPPQEPMTQSAEPEITTPPIADKLVEEPPAQVEEQSKQVEELSNGSSPQKTNPSEQQPSSGTIRAPTHPELAARKPKGSKTYKPNLVQHEHSKRSDSAKSSTSSPSRPSSSSTPSSSNSKATTKSGSSSNLSTSNKQNQKHQNNNNNNITDRNDATGSSTRGRSRGRRDTATAQGLKDNSAPAASSNDSSLPNATPSSVPPTSAGSSPAQQQQQQSVQTALAQRSTRAKTPGPALAGGPQDHSSPLGVKKKKKKRNKRKDRSPPPELAMELECDLRISRPAVTPTPPPVQQRDSTPVKKSADPERSANSSSASSKPSRETRAKSADPKLYYESKKERNKDKQRNRDEDGKRSRTKDDRKEQDKNKEKQDNRDRETRKEKEPDGLSKVEATVEVGKLDRNERKESPVPKSIVKSSAETAKHSCREEPKETPKEATIVEKEKETSKESAKDVKDLKTKDFTKEKEALPKDKETVDALDDKEHKQSDKTLAVKDVSETPYELTKQSKPEKKKKKKSLLKGPNLIKGRREVVEEPEAIVADEQRKESTETVVVIEDTPPPSVSQSSDPEPSSQSKNRQKEIAISSKPASIIAEHPSVVATSTASIVQRTASPRPWKSPGEKKLIPPAITSMITHHPMSPPTPERSRTTPTPTPTSPGMSPEPPHHHHHQQRIHLAASPVAMPQPDVLTRMPLQSSITPLVATTIAPPVNTFAPVMNLLNQMQEIDNKMSDFQRRKMQIDSEMMRLNSEKFQIDQNSMQLQNERFMLLNTLRAALVECELTTLASRQSVSHMPAAATSPATLGNRRRHPDSEPESAPRNKRRKDTQQDLMVSATPQSPYRQVPITSSATELSEPEEPVTTGCVTPGGGERTIRRITKISGNTEILKLFQRRRLISDRSTEESQPEDNVASIAPTDPVTPTVDKPTAAKRRRTRTYGGGNVDHSEGPGAVVRLRSDSTKSVESGRSIEIIDHSAAPVVVVPPPVVPTATTRLKKDEEIPLGKHRDVLPLQVKVVVSRLNVAAKNKRACPNASL